MKRWIAALISLMMMLGLAACTSAPTPTEPVASYDLAYNMENYDYFSEIFEEKSSEEWDAMGRYTMLLEGLSTPVVVTLEGMNVLSVSAYGQTAELGEAGAVYQGDCPVDMQSAENALVVNISWDYDGETNILTESRCFRFQPEGAISTQIFAREDGTLTYYRYWGEYATSFFQSDMAPLELCTSRDHFLYETGHAEIVGGEVVLTAENTVTVADEYDLDALFAEARDNGFFEAYETVDQLLAANQARANEP